MAYQIDNHQVLGAIFGRGVQVISQALILLSVFAACTGALDGAGLDQAAFIDSQKVSGDALSTLKLSKQR